MVNTRSANENKTRGSAEEGRTEPAIEIDLETPDQSVDEVEKKKTESTPMPNAEEQKQKSVEFSPIDTVEDTTGNTPQTIKDESQTKRTLFTERLAMMVGMKSRDIVEEEQKAEKGKTFGTVSTITTEANQDDDQVNQGATTSHGATADHETTADQAMMSFEKRRQRDDESIDWFLDDLESLRRRSDPEESTNRRNFSIASKFIDGVKSDDLRIMLATYYTLSKDSAPTPEEMRQKSREYMLMKPQKYSYSDNRNMQGGSQPQRSSWYKPRDDMDKRRSCANCGSADHHVADCTTYKQGMKSLGYAPDEEDMSHGRTRVLQRPDHQDRCKMLLLQSREPL